MTTIVDGQAGITFNDASVQGTAGYTGFRNRIINGAMQIDQRNAGASVTATSSGIFPVDRFRTGGSSFGQTFTLQQVSDAPSGFVNSLKVTVSTAVASPGATAESSISQLIEGYNSYDFLWGTGSAKTVTLSFWVKSSIAGTYSVALSNSDTTSYLALYTISAANQWQYQTVTVPGSNVGVWASTNSTGVRIDWNLGSGSNYLASAGSWLVTSSGNYYISTAGTVQLVQTVNATLQITGAQLEVGGVATAFERRLYNVELAMCQRYYYQQSANTPIVGQTAFFSIPFNLPVTMRTSPSVGYPYTDATFTSSGTVPSGQWGIQYVGVSAASKTGTVAFSYATPTANSGMIYTTGATWSQTTNWLQSTNLAAVTFSAEL